MLRLRGPGRREASARHVSKIVIDMHDAVVTSQTIKVLVGARMVNERIGLRDVRLRGDVPERASGAQMIE